jgi:hypothetical protein
VDQDQFALIAEETRERRFPSLAIEQLIVLDLFAWTPATKLRQLSLDVLELILQIVNLLVSFRLHDLFRMLLPG